LKKGDNRIARQKTLPTEPKSFSQSTGSPRGVLQSADPLAGNFFHSRLAPPPLLTPWIQHYWMIQWDLRTAGPRVQETLPHPSVYLLFEHDLHEHTAPTEAKHPEIAGVCTGKFTRHMEGWSRVFGVKFRPGAFHAFLGHSVATLTDRVVPAEQIFGVSITSLAQQTRLAPTADAMAAAATTFFTARAPQPDAPIKLSTQLVELIFNDPTILTVDHLATRASMGLRSLQRLFKDYVGVSPKWVIRRYRLHELVERFHSGQPFDGAQLAFELGYADQAHLINDFRKIVGYAPSKYRKLSPQKTKTAQ
jgi:AraC-like DNA-binding protein